MNEPNTTTLTKPDPKKIHNIFSDIANSYDTVNNTMTFGLVHLWRKKVVKLSNTPKDSKVLDCATGTGDLAIEFKQTLGPKAKVTGVDFCKEMLDLAFKKSQHKNLNLEFKLGDILNLKFDDETFNTVTIAYGIRNVANTVDGITEMWRTVKPGGKLLILETGQGTGLINLPITIYTKYVIPILGGLISKKKHAYSYLSHSSQAFPSKKKFLQLTKDLKKIKKASYKSLMFGASYIYILEKK